MSNWTFTPEVPIEELPSEQRDLAGLLYPQVEEADEALLEKALSEGFELFWDSV